MLKDIDENIIYEYSNMSISSNLLIEEKIFNIISKSLYDFKK